MFDNMKFALATVLCGSLSLLAADAPKRPQIVGLSHIAFYVHDMEKTRAFYKDFLGFAEPYSLTNKDGSLHLTWIKINDRQSLELFPEKEAGSNRLYHIALETDDAVAMRDYLAAHGVKVPAKVGKGKIGNLNYFVTDPDGHIVEIVQYAPDGWTLLNQGKFLPDTRIATGMPHAGILVGDVDASAQNFYASILGFHEIWRGAEKTDATELDSRADAGGDGFPRIHAVSRTSRPGQAWQVSSPLPGSARHRKGQSHHWRARPAHRVHQTPGNPDRHQPQTSVECLRSRRHSRRTDGTQNRRRPSRAVLHRAAAATVAAIENLELQCLLSYEPT